MNAARDLAATGTPGPWELSKPSGDPWIEQTGLTGGTVLEPERVDCMAYCYGGSSRYNLSDDDAAKIVAAVNALPLVADLLDALQEEDEHRVECAACVGCTPGNTLWIVAMVAREQLTAALRGES